MYNISVPVDAQLLQQWRNTTFNETGNIESHTSFSQHEPHFNVFTIGYLFTATGWQWSWHLYTKAQNSNIHNEKNKDLRTHKIESKT
jgi:hypothetical protein